MKIYKGLSRYVLDEKGNVFERESGLQLSTTLGQFILTTDEEFISTLKKGKKFNIVRRYDKTQIIKMYNDDKSLSIEEFEKFESSGKPFKENPIVSKPETLNVEEKNKKDKKVSSKKFQFEINGVKYKNANEASKALGISLNTVTNRVKKGVEGYKAL